MCVHPENAKLAPVYVRPDLVFSIVHSRLQLDYGEHCLDLRNAT